MEPHANTPHPSRLWSSGGDPDSYNVTAATPRLHAFRCRLVARGIAASPIGVAHDGPYQPGYCTFELGFSYVPPGGTSGASGASYP